MHTHLYLHSHTACGGCVGPGWRCGPASPPPQGAHRDSCSLPAQMEAACVTIHEALRTVIESQTHYRLREAQDRARAEDLNSRVSYWSVSETVALFVVSVSQVLLLKSFFTERRPVSRAVPS